MAFEYNLGNYMPSVRTTTSTNTGVQMPSVRMTGYAGQGGTGQGVQLPTPGAITGGTQGGLDRPTTRQETVTNAMMGLKGWGEQLIANRQAREQRKIDAEYANREYEWKTHIEPAQTEYARRMEQDALDEANRALAEASARYGYYRSAGAGTAGMYEMGQYNLESKALSVRAAIATVNQNYLRDLYTSWHQLKDQQAFQEEMVRLQAYYREQYAEKIADLNEPSWWSQLGSVIGSALALIPGLGGVAAAAGGAVGGGVGYSLGNWMKG